MRKRILMTLFTALLGLFLHSEDAMEKHIRVLTIGNSFSFSVTRYLPSIVKSTPGCKLTIFNADHGGCTLERHWNYITEEEEKSDVKWYDAKRSKLKEALLREPWDFITMQQASELSWHPETYQPFAKDILAYVRKIVPATTEIVIQQTWAYREDATDFKRWGITQGEMYDKLTEAYRQCARELGDLRIIPTGEAIQIARATQKAAFVPLTSEQEESLKTLKHPEELPQEKNTFSAGYIWRRNKETNEYYPFQDTHHLGRRGEYLQACLWFGFLFKADPRKITFVPDEITKEDAVFLRECAAKALKMPSQISEKEQTTKE